MHRVSLGKQADDHQPACKENHLSIMITIVLNETKALTMSVVTNIVVFALSASLNRYVMYFNIEFPQKNLNNKMQDGRQYCGQDADNE
jgi:hypothetical protein